MKRRELIALIGGATVALPFTAGAQQGERVRRIGLLMAFAESDPAAQSQVAAFRDALAKLGWTEGTISGSSCVGALVIRTGSAHWQESWSNCDPMQSSVRPHR
jgi:hypothetical protein